MADDHAALGHGSRARRKGNAHNGGEELRRHPDRQGNGEQQRLEHRPTEKLVDHQDEDDDQGHHPNQHGSELPDAPGEVRFRLPLLQARGDRPEDGASSCLHHNDRRRSAPYRAAEEDGVSAAAEGRLRRKSSRPFLDREGLARQAGFNDEKVLCVHDEAVCRDQVAGGQQDEVAGHQLPRGEDPRSAVPDHPALEGEPALQLRNRRRGPILLEKPEERAAQERSRE